MSFKFHESGQHLVPAGVRHVQVEHDAVKRDSLHGLQKFFTRRVGLNVQTRRTNQPLQRHAYRMLVIDHGNPRVGSRHGIATISR
jgi:hypothetical protein